MSLKNDKTCDSAHYCTTECKELLSLNYKWDNKSVSDILVEFIEKDHKYMKSGLEITYVIKVIYTNSESSPNMNVVGSSVPLVFVIIIILILYKINKELNLNMLYNISIYRTYYIIKKGIFDIYIIKLVYFILISILII
ncbi:hypothetical protein PGO_002765 [Plasmodium gonderi]|uniref:Variable surface protein n=1 Tax=Plasmodium gonderi TaxID=77519 RepID=A0A1Y1JTD9_PLAGO|nr:hypothetical protein PGO_002765 [Plasmodium gonderi]GAW84397.1 hypothetical protein PGO_002765 [Plasmodium gonderi]